MAYGQPDDAQYNPYAGIMTPDMLQQQQMQQLQTSLNTAQATGHGGSMAAGQLSGGGVASALKSYAGPSPQEQLAAQNQQAMANAPTDPDQLDAYAATLQGSNPRMAQALSNLADIKRQQKAKLLQTGAETIDSLSKAAASDADAQYKKGDLEVRQRLGHAASPQELADFQATQGRIPPGHFLVIQADGTPKIEGTYPPPAGSNLADIMVDTGNGMTQRYWVPKGGDQNSPGAKAIGEPRDANGRTSGMLQQGLERVLMSGSLGTADIGNIAQLPWNSDVSLFGTGTKPTSSILDVAAKALKTHNTSQQDQLYSVMTGGFSRVLGNLEAINRAPGQALVNSLENLKAQPEDTQLTRASKLAQVKQIIYTALEQQSQAPYATKSQTARMQDLMGQLDKAVPYTQQDILNLSNQSQKNPKVTLGDVLKQKQQAAASAVPPDQADLIRDSYRRLHGVVPSDAQINATYQAAQAK